MLVLNGSPRFIDYLCDEVSDIPTGVLSSVRPELIGGLGQSAAVMFPAFARAFPLTIKAIEYYWPVKTRILFSKGQQWVYDVVLERLDLNLFFNNPTHPDDEIEGELFENHYAMLPTRWKELYRWFDSFCIIENTMGGNVIENTPFCYSGRLDLEGYRQEYGLKKVVIREFEETIGSKKMRCWMVTDAGDSLWLDEEGCDHKVYHVKSSDFKNYYVLPNPEAKLDQYLAHYVSGAKPADFDWRKQA